MYRGGPGAIRGGDALSRSGRRAASTVRTLGTTAQATTAGRCWTGFVGTFATASLERAAPVLQQSLAVPFGAHASSPSLQQAI